MIILFPSFPFDVKRCDPGFEVEAQAAREAGFEVAFVDTELGTNLAFHGLPRSVEGTLYGTVLYRGWILKPERYAALEEAVIMRGYSLVTSLQWYLESYEFPRWYRSLEGYTPSSLVLRLGDGWDIDRVIGQVGRVFGNRPIIVKDYVKSRKHEWWDACFIKPADDPAEVKRVVTNFMERQGSDLAGGLVFREFIEYKRAGTHPKSGMPIIQEWRLFVWKHEVIYSAPYWSAHAASYDAPMPWASMTRIADAIQKLDSQFFVLDAAQRLDGLVEIVEVNDAGTAGIPEGGSAIDFYAALHRCS